MKKNSIYALMSAIALSGAIGFSSCSSTEDDVANVNPGYDPATGDVPVQFVFNVSMGNTPTTRQTAEATQANYDANDQTNTQKFRGIDHCLILSKAQKVGETTNPDDGKYISSPTTMDKMYDLSRVLDANAISSTNSRRVLEMAFPLNTNSLMFYGKAIVGDLTSAQTDAGLTQNDVYGHLKTDGYAVTENLSNVSFEVSKRLTSANVTTYKEIQKLLAGVLSTIMNTNLAGNNQDDISATATPGANITPYGFTISKSQYNSFYWADYYYAGEEAGKMGKSPALPVANELPYSVNLTPLEEKLANAYKAMTSIDSKKIEGYSDGDELRAGAGDAVEAMIKDLWSIVNSVRCATPTSYAETIAKYMAAKIHSCISQYFVAEDIPTNGGPVTGVHFNDVGTVKSRLVSAENKYWPTGTGASSKPASSDFNNIDNNYVLGNFPYSFHLPAGATHLAFDDTKKEFSYIWNYSTAGMPGETNAFTVESYYFPPELLYFGNSPVRVCSKERQVEDYPSTVADWHDENQWQAITEGNETWSWYINSHVIASTRSVAMINDINYGTALLKTKVGYKLDEAEGLNDNNDKFHDGEGANIIPVDNTSFQLVGVLVGGQSKKVGWDFLPTPTTAPSTYTYGYVYDCDIVDTQIPATGVSKPNYTLVFDNYHAGVDNQDVVYVSLELLNNSGKDFYGKNGLVKNGEKFYLIGKLAPAEASNKDAIVWPTYHPMPPYDANGNSIHVPRVFMQDYMTSVNFKIGVNSLKYAYLTVPDLRSSSLTLGLAVDIEWRTGLNFGDVIVGGE